MSCYITSQLMLTFPSDDCFLSKWNTIYMVLYKITQLKQCVNYTWHSWHQLLNNHSSITIIEVNRVICKLIIKINLFLYCLFKSSNCYIGLDLTSLLLVCMHFVRIVHLDSISKGITWWVRLLEWMSNIECGGIQLTSLK